ncbi:MAG: rod shape-determining protein MreC [Myxococcota bacterium]
MYKKFLYVIFIVIPLILIILSIIYQSEPIVISSKILSIFYPLKSLFLYIEDKTIDIKEFFRLHASLLEENKSLKEELKQISAKGNLLNSCLNENIELKRFLDYRYESDYKLILVRVVEYIKSYSKDVVVVDAGESRGIKKGMYAITGDGLAGKVIETNNSFSYIRLLSDRRSFFSVTSINNQTKGIIQGEGRFTYRLTMKYIPMSSNVEINDIVVTSQSIETYSVPGIPIGIIKDVKQFSKDMFQEAYIMPFVKFDKIDYMFIIVGF